MPSTEKRWIKESPKALAELNEIVRELPLRHARRVLIEIRMVQMCQTYRQIAKRHRMSAWYLSGAVRGILPIAQKHIDALEADLSVVLDKSWLTLEEVARLKK